MRRTGAKPSQNPGPGAEHSAQPGKKAALRLPRWRLVLIVLSLLGFLVFFCPVFGGILNPVNLGAMAGFLVLAAVFCWWSGFVRLLRRVWSRRWGKVLLLVSGVGLLALVLLVLMLCGAVLARLRAVPKEPCPTVIVLGCQVRGTAPSLLLSYRIEAAAAYLEANPGSAAVLTGGKGSGENISEAECMYRGLIARGIDPARLYKEEEATDTLENIRFSMAVMEREGLSGPAALVSNDIHICRAERMAADLGLEACGLAAKTSWYSRPTYVLREALALAYYLLSP